jgi:hypothetical protein
MAELLLTHGYFLYEDPKELQIMKPYAPLGICTCVLISESRASMSTSLTRPFQIEKHSFSISGQRPPPR